MKIIALEEMNRVFPGVADELRSGGTIVIEDEGRPVARIYREPESQTAVANDFEARRLLVQQLREDVILPEPPITLEEILDWIDEGRA